MMNVLMLFGSRNPEGQTATAAKALANGVRSAGGTVTEAYLPEKKLERCRQCENNGWGICRTQGECIIDDDFAGLVDEIRAADGVVLANPVYFSDLSESMRGFLDRLRRICFNEDGRVGVEGKPSMAICVAGGSGNGAPACGASMDKALKAARLEVEDVVLVRRQNLAMKKPLLEATGQWFGSLNSAGDA
jgi:multimeric flavodoxin WrbA